MTAKLIKETNKAGKKLGFNKKKTFFQSEALILVSSYLLIVLLKSFIAFQTNSLDLQSFYLLRIARSLFEKNLLAISDGLGSTQVLTLPLMPALLKITYSLLKLLGLNVSLISVGKALTILLSTTIIFPSFKIAKLVSKNKTLALIIAVSSGFSALFFSKTVVTVSAMSLALPLAMLFYYHFAKLQGLQALKEGVKNERSKSLEKRFLKHYYCALASYVLLALTSSFSMLVLFSILVYFVIAQGLGLKINKASKELTIFLTILTVWGVIVFYKDLITSTGLSFLLNAKSRFNIASIASLNPFISLLFLHSAYISIARKKKQGVLLTSVVIAMVVAYFSNIATLADEYVLNMIAMLMLVSSSISIIKIYNYLKLFRWRFASKAFIAVLVLMFLTTIIVPGLVQASLNVKNVSKLSNVLQGLTVLKPLPEGGVVCNPSLGFAVAYITGKKPVLDSNSLLNPWFKERFRDVKKIYSLRLETPALELLVKYNAKYIILSSLESSMFNVTRIAYTNDCVKLLKNDSSIKIYEARCVLNEG